MERNNAYSYFIFFCVALLCGIADLGRVDET